MKKILLVSAVAGIVMLSACGQSSPVEGGGGGGEPVSGRSGWTALGTRASDSAPNREVREAAGAQWSDYDPPVEYPRRQVEANHYISMDDGIRLGATVAFPADAEGNVPSRPLPVILTLTGYSKDNGGLVAPTIGGPQAFLLEHGYIHVNVDVRGTGRSDGTWMALDEREQRDYRQVVDWLVQQPWCNGRVGLHGTSLLGLTAILTASKGHPAVKAVYVVAAPLGDAYRDVALVGGQGSFGFLSIWMSFIGAMGMVNAAAYQDPAQYLQATLEHAGGFLLGFQLPTLLNALAGDPETVYDTDFWALRSPVERAADIRVPVFMVSGLHDVFQRGAPRFYDALKNHTRTKLLMGPWNHIEVSADPVPGGGVPEFRKSALMWFDHYLKGMDNGAEDLPNVTQWVWGAERYVQTRDWPNPRARAQRLYLHGDRSVAAALPAAGAAPRSILQQPFNGICSQSASQVSLGILGLVPLPCFQNDNVANALEVVYETAPMAEDFYIDGPIQADLWVSTTAQDAGLTVRVSDVAPDGGAFNLANGLQMASQRAVDPAKSRYLDGQMIQPWHPFTAASKQAVGSGNLVQVAVEVFPTSALIRQGHKLRVSVGASNFPYGLSPLPDLLASLTGVLSVHSDAEHPSSIVLPVVPASVLD